MLALSAPAGASRMDTKAHWEGVYSTRQSDQVSWFQAIPAPSLRLLERADIGPGT
jgi:hypothetical protein